MDITSLIGFVLAFKGAKVCLSFQTVLSIKLAMNGLQLNSVNSKSHGERKMVRIYGGSN